MTSEGKKRANGVISHKIFSDCIIFKVEEIGELTLDLKLLSEANARAGLTHGMIQRIRDAAALSRSRETGKPASSKDKFDAMAELCEWYNSGAEEWSPGRSEGNGIGGEKGLLIRVLKRAGAKMDDVEGWVKGKTGGDVKVLLNSAKLKPFADEIRAEGASKIDPEEMLSELGLSGEEEKGLRD